MNDIYYLSMYREKANHAGSKAVDDCETIMQRRGYKKIALFTSKNKNKLVKKISNTICLMKILLVKNGGLVVIEHPVYIKYNYFNVIIYLKRFKHCRIAFIIHDLESYRNILPDSQFYANRDYEMIKIADCVIVHNDMMKKYLSEQGLNDRKMISLEIFDYLIDNCNSNINGKKNENNTIVIAGNLSPKACGYIYSLSTNVLSNYKLKLYGGNFSENYKNDKVIYCGSFSPNELPSIMQGKYGLVWYGNDLNKCGGNIEKYLHIINPHKVSSYLAAGIPVIISKNIGISDFISKNNLGIVIDNLNGLEDILENISDKEYSDMKHNVMLVRKKILNGYFLNNALETMEAQEGYVRQ